MQILWKIGSMERASEDGFVLTAHWRVLAEDQLEGEVAPVPGTSYGSKCFARDPEVAGFVPYADLTEETVVGWVKAQMGEEAVARAEAAAIAQITAQRQPPILAGLPWSEK